MSEIDPKRNQGRDPFFARLDPVVQNRMKELFVEPQGFSKEPADNIERLFLIKGKREAGKLIAAINLAIELAKTGNEKSPVPIFTYQHQGDTLFDLNGIVTNSAFKEKAVYILPNVFRYGLPSSSLSEDKVRVYQQELRDKNAYLILTSANEDYPDDESMAIKPLSVDGVNLQAVMKKHLDFYYKDSTDDVVAQLLAGESPADCPPEILKLLTELGEAFKRLDSPKKIGRLFSDLRNSTIQVGNEIQSILELIYRITRTDSTSLRRWFRELNLNTKVFAMLVAILLDNRYELNLFDAEELYYSFVQRARQKRGMDGEYTFIDPRRIGVDDIVASANMSRWNNTLSFNSEVQAQIILDYEVANYHGLLWVLAELLIEHIEPAPRRYARNPAIPQYIGHPDLPQLSFTNAELVLANLVGYIGIYRRHKLLELLDKLTDSPHSVLIGEVLRPIARFNQHHDFLWEVLDVWLYPKTLAGKASKAFQPNDFMAAAYAIAEIYPLMLQAYGMAEEQEPVRKKLYDFLHHMAEICGTYDSYIDNYELETKKALEEEFNRREAAGKGLSETEKENERELLHTLVHQHLLTMSEASSIVLLYLIQNIAEQYPEDMVEIIEAWLRKGKQKGEQESEQEDDSEIERLLAVDDVIAVGETQGKIAQERAAEATRSRLNTMTWHIGMFAAVMFFQISSAISRQDEEKEAAKEEKKKAKEHTQADEDDEEEKTEAKQTENDDEAKTDDEDEERVEGTGLVNQSSGVEEVIDPGQELEKAKTKLEDALLKTPEKPEKLTEDKRPETRTAGLARSDTRSNRLDIISKQFPLLRLLPALLDSSEMPFSEYSFLYNLPRSSELASLFRKKEIYYLYDNPRGFLGEDPLREAFRAMHKWYEILVRDRKKPDSEGHELWMANVYPVLLNLFNKASQGQRLLLRNLLFSEGWVESAHEGIRHVAHALLARSYILDGRVLDLPSERYGVVLLDAGMRNNYNWYAYHHNAYRLIQQLTTLTPVHLYHMGSTEVVKKLGQDKETSPLLSRELHPRRTHPRLLMPFFEKILKDSEKIHFVLVLSPMSYILSDMPNGIQADILDLADVLEMASAEAGEIDPKYQKILSSSMYTDAEKEVARQAIAKAQSTGDWAWKQKLFLVSPRKEEVRQLINQELIQKQMADGQKRHLQNDVEEFLSIIGVNSPSFSGELDLLEVPLSLQIASTLHQLSPNDWESDLEKVWSNKEAKLDVLPDFNLRDAEAVRRQILQWTAQLGDVTKAQHPRDISMTIIWTILGLSRFDFSAAIGLVRDYLEDESDELTQIMAIACSKTLFNFYRLSPDLLENVGEYSQLLQLLPAFLRTERGQESSEFWQIFSILMLWARSDEWAAACLEDGSSNPVAKAVQKIKSAQAISDLRRLLRMHETVLVLARIYKQTGLYWNEFHKVLLDVAQWSEKTPLHERNSKLSAFAASFKQGNLNENLITSILEVISQSKSEISSYYGTKIGFGHFIERIGANVANLGVQSLAELESYERNVQQTANQIRLQLYGGSSRLEPMPRPQEGKRYGVIIFNSSTRGNRSDIRSKVIGFVKHFRQLSKEKQAEKDQTIECEKIDFTVHRLGRNQHIPIDDKQAPSQQKLRLPDGTPEFAPLLSPILERYQPEHVAFVLVVSDRQPYDLDDWRGNEVWLDRIFLLSRRTHSWMREFYGESNSNRTRRLKEEIEELTKFIMEFIGC